MTLDKATVILGKNDICKDCIKADVCKHKANLDKDPIIGMSVEKCEYFKDKSKFIETAYPKTFESIRKIYTTAKNEAIKEFAERLNAKAQNADTWTGIEPVVTISDIKDTAKEMVGDEVV